MKKVIIDGNTYWYNRKVAALFYDYRMTRQFPRSCFNTAQYISFLEQIK